MKNKLNHYFKHIFFFAILILIVQVPSKIFLSEKVKGWDHDIYCLASSAFESGKDPYLTQNLGDSLSYAYPALFLKFYSPLCGLAQGSYVWIHFLCLLGLVFLFVKFLKTDLLVSLAWIFLGFNAAYANYTTGNIGIFEALLFGFFLVGYNLNKPWSSIFLVPSAFLKVVPLAMISPAVLVGRDKKFKIKALILFLTSLVVLNIFTYLLAPDLFSSYLNQLLGHYAQHSPVTELDSNPSNITILLFIKNFSMLFGGEYYWLPLLALVIGLALFSAWLWRSQIKTSNERILQLCWSYLILFLWLPRLKPYSMLIACLVMIPILKNKKSRVVWGLLLISIFHRTLNGDKVSMWWDFIANNTAIYAYFAVLIILAKSKDQWPLNSFEREEI